MQRDSGMQTRGTIVRYSLGSLLALGALNAFAGGYYALAGAKGVPREWLTGSPFTSYFIPGLFLFVVVGGALLAASIAVFASWRAAQLVAVAAAAIVLAWLAVQVAIIGYVSWMQPVTALSAIAILVLAWRLRAPITKQAARVPTYPPATLRARRPTSRAG